jgi:hypothetical protein
MTQHETWTVPPGMAISDGSGGTQKPVVAAGTPAAGDTLVWDGTTWVPQATTVVAAEVTFTETTGAGTYTGTVIVPAGATIVDLIVTQVAQWTAATSATLKVGDAGDDDGFISGLNLKTYPVGQSESALAFNNSGAYVSQVLLAGSRYSASSHTITGVVTTVGTTGNAGRTRLLVLYALATPTAASKT